MDRFEVGQRWGARNLRSKLALTVAVIWSAYTLSHLCNLFFYLGLVVYPITHRAVSAALICTLVYLLVAAEKGNVKGNAEMV